MCLCFPHLDLTSIFILKVTWYKIRTLSQDYVVPGVSEGLESSSIVAVQFQLSFICKGPNHNSRYHYIVRYKARKSLAWIFGPVRLFLCGDFMLILCMRGFPPDILVSSHSPKICMGYVNWQFSAIHSCEWLSVSLCLSGCLSSGVCPASYPGVGSSCPVTLNWISGGK